MAITEQFLWVEKYRPKKIEDCILPKAIKTSAQAFVAQGDLPNLLLAGGPGMGKTTLALALCAELGIDAQIINASDERGIDTIRTKIINYGSSISFDGKRRYVILDEADFLTPEAQGSLRTTMETLAVNCGFILTCNHATRIIPALHSRCSVVNYAIPPDERTRLMAGMLKRLQFILAAENVQAEEKLLIGVIKKRWPDMRSMINAIQASVVDGAVAPTVLGSHADVQFDALWKAIRARDYGEVRKWVTEYQHIDAPTFYRAVFDWAHDVGEPNSIPAVVVLTADYQYRNQSAIDQQIHLSAYCLELMGHLQFKA